MNIHKLKFSFGDETALFYELLKKEDFDFKTKNIKVSIKYNDLNKAPSIEVVIECNSLIDSKIGISAVLKSLEIIEKTLNTTN